MVVFDTVAESDEAVRLDGDGESVSHLADSLSQRGSGRRRRPGFADEPG